MKRTRLSLALLLALAAAACTGGDDGGTTPPPPEPGVLTVSLTTPNGDDRALVVELTGPSISEVASANAAYVVHARPAGTGGVRAAVFGSLGSGALLRFQVPDVNNAAAYKATVVEVADAGNALRQTTGYTAAVAR
ncbi:MAG TPA: hypothetical protein VEQ60_25190 [Longimicrobium sp.]|nr:hypothetical protein [Longimicrobium sp.]